MARRLPPDRLPKGTRLQLRLLLARCEALEAARVYIGRYEMLALERILAYLDANDVEGGKS